MGLLKSDSSDSGNYGNTNSNSFTGGGGGGFNAVLDRGSEFEGKLTFEGTVRIDGKFKGEIFSSARLIVGESGKIEANVSVDSISISGEVVGDITAKTKVEIHAPAVVRGNIKSPKLVVEEGAVIEGGINMSALSGASAGSSRKVGIAVEDDSKATNSKGKDLSA